MRIKIEITYDGTDFCGWQIQPSLSSVQGELEKALEKLTGEKSPVVASGRTDAGVHALGQVASFKLSKPFEVGRMVFGLNFYLPSSIRVTSAKRVEDQFSAISFAKNKTYIYLMYNALVDNPLLNNKALRAYNLDFNQMISASPLFEGTHDFSSFMSRGSMVKSTVRTINKCQLFQRCGFYILEINANGFLYNMVRKIMGFLLAIGQGKRSAEEITKLLMGGGVVNEMAPSHALYLKSVEY